MKNKRVPNRIKATCGFGCEINAGGAVAQIHNQNSLEQISSAACYLHCGELDILEAIDTPEKVIETTTVIKTINLESNRKEKNG